MRYLEALALQQAGAPMLDNKMQDPDDLQQKARDERPPESLISAEVRSLAAELGVDLSTVVGTGKDGRILMRDVRTAAEEPKP